MKTISIVTACVAFLGIALVLLIVSEREAMRKTESFTGCEKQRILLEVVATQGIIGEVRQDGKDVVIKVTPKYWLKTNRKIRKDIAMAAYCHATLMGKEGIVRVEDGGGHEFGRVVDGKWSSKYGS